MNTENEIVLRRPLHIGIEDFSGILQGVIFLPVPVTDVPEHHGVAHLTDFSGILLSSVEDLESLGPLLS